MSIEVALAIEAPCAADAESLAYAWAGAVYSLLPPVKGQFAPPVVEVYEPREFSDPAEAGG